MKSKLLAWLSKDFKKMEEVTKVKEIAATTDDCISCEEDLPFNGCCKSMRPCGHHCNHSWTHDECCWCGENLAIHLASQKEIL